MSIVYRLYRFFEKEFDTKAFAERI